MKRIAVIGVVAAAACLFSGIMASGALAVVGPFWLVELTPGVFDLLGTNENAEILDSSLGSFVLESSVADITCSKVDSEGLLVGGNPGKDTSNVTFLGCTVNGASECHVWSKGLPFGTVFVELNSELVYLEKTQNTNIGDLFTPKTGNKFVKLRSTALSSGACPAGVPATGEEEIVNGTLIEFGTTSVEGSIVAKAEPINVHQLLGTLLFPAAKIEKAFLNSSGAFKEVKPGLKAFGVEGANEVGTEDVWLESDKLWGVQP